MYTHEQILPTCVPLYYISHTGEGEKEREGRMERERKGERVGSTQDLHKNGYGSMPLEPQNWGKVRDGYRGSGAC